MNKNLLSLIKRALYDAEVIEIKRLEALPEAPFSPSEECISRARTEFAQGKRQVARRKTLKGVVAILVAAILLISVTVTCIAFRENIKEFFIEKFEKFSIFTTPDVTTDKTEIEEFYLPAYIPEGFTKTDVFEDSTEVMIVWEREDEMIVYSQSLLTKSAIIKIDTETSDYQTKDVGERTVYYISHYSEYFMIWRAEDYSFTLKCSNSYTCEEDERINDGIVIVNTKTD